MNSDDIYTIVTKYLVEEFEISEKAISPEANLFEDLELDSIDALDMIAILESEMDLGIDEEELKKILTIQDIVTYITNNLSDKKML